jgi:hypothetical protein
MVITGLGDRIAGRIKALVYLDAFVPGDGESLMARRSSRLRLAAIMLRHKYPKRRGERNVRAFMLVDDAELGKSTPRNKGR